MSQIIRPPSGGSLLDDVLLRLMALPPEEQEAVMAEAERACAGMFFLPNPGPQTEAYFSPAQLLYYGGEAGGGKSDLIVGTALNDHSNCRVFRTHFKDVDGVGGLAERFQEIMRRAGLPEATRPSPHVYRLPDLPERQLENGLVIPLRRGRKLEFGAFTNDREAEDYRGRAADFIGFDEVQQFLQHLVRFIIGWNRTTIKGQRCRAILCGNPPTEASEMWIIDEFKPWVDDNHPEPALPGELRWYTTIGKDLVEVGPDWRGETNAGVEILPMSRTFIRAGLADNPDLAETGYASNLASMPAHLRDALMDGKYSANLATDAWAVFPTEWILAAQQRWIRRQEEFDHGHALRGPMTDMGADIAMGPMSEKAARAGSNRGETHDRVVLTPLWGTFFGEQIAINGAEIKRPQRAAARIFEHITDDALVKVDCTGGWGSGVIEHLESNGHPCVVCISSETNFAATSREGWVFSNNRAQWAWELREALDPDKGDDICLPPGRELLQELAAYRWQRVTVDGRQGIKVRSKDEIIAIIGRSPDLADSLILAWAERDALRGVGGRDGFHPERGRFEVRHANSAAKSRLRNWRSGGRK